MMPHAHAPHTADLEREEWLRKIRSVLRSFGRDVAEPRDDEHAHRGESPATAAR